MHVLVALFLWLISTLAAAEGVIVVGQKDGAFAYSVVVNKSTKAEAATEALRHCQSNGASLCHVTTNFSDSCVAFATSSEGLIPGYGSTEYDAVRDAHRKCREKNLYCTNQNTYCDHRLLASLTVAERQRQADEQWRRALEEKNAVSLAKQQRDEALIRATRAEEELKKLKAPHPWLAYVYARAAEVVPLYQSLSHQVHLALAAAFGAVVTALVVLFGLRKKPAEGDQPPIEEIADVTSTLSLPLRILSAFKLFDRSPKAAPTPQAPHRSEPQFAQATQTQQPSQPTGVPGSLMQASLRHERSFNSSYVVLTLKFSREAHQLIRARGIEHLVVLSGELTRPPPGAVEVVGMDWFFRLSGLVGAFGIIPCFIYGVAGGGNAAGGLLTLCVILLGVRFIGPRLLIKSWDTKDYTIKSFLRQPTVRLYADNPVFAKALIDQIKEKIADLRMLLEDSKELPAEETIEL